MMRLTLTFLASLFLLSLLTACGDEGPSHGPGQGSREAAETDDFYLQSAWPAYLAAHGAGSPFTPARSDWERVEALESSERLSEDALCGTVEEATEAWARARDLLGPLQAEHLDITLRGRELDDGLAEGLLQRWGFRDDSLAGIDHRVRFRRAGECLTIERVEARHYCRRGVERGARCL
ncbi:hypothetical protein [Natronospira bacteriovora]|uniref:Lipoprotein n=1 Tax=Natronospira bacteriovora TaxID=3069753 RepID=A0ABU0W5R7_9GAMM|nr:hypothetical protein [Natronospira sp. AB-CW4]MDQ2069372.1 hypothetical protein [Natronospira sp. AB-CW4]